MKERSLNLQELLVEINNGSVTSTKQLDFQTKGTVHNNPDLISGNSFQDSKGLITNKNNLKLTKKGEDMLALGKLTLKDIDNSHGKDSFMSRYGRPVILFCVIGLIGFSAKWVWENKLSTAKAPEKSVQKTTQGKNNQNDSSSPPK